MASRCCWLAAKPTPQVIDLYRRARSLQRRGADRQTCHAAERDCDRMLGLRLWDFSVSDDFMFDSDEPPDYLLKRGTNAGAGWHHVRSLREQLQGADRELRR